MGRRAVALQQAQVVAGRLVEALGRLAAAHGGSAMVQHARLRGEAEAQPRGAGVQTEVGVL